MRKPHSVVENEVTAWTYVKHIFCRKTTARYYFLGFTTAYLLCWMYYDQGLQFDEDVMNLRRVQCARGMRQPYPLKVNRMPQQFFHI